MLLFTPNDYKALVASDAWKRVKEIAAMKTTEEQRVAERQFATEGHPDRVALAELTSRMNVRNMAQMKLDDILLGVTSVEEIERKAAVEP